MQRGAFVFSDSLEVGGYLGSGCVEGEIAEASAAELARILSNGDFAGIVCMAN